MKVSDEAVAEAPRLAKAKLDQQGWKYNTEEIGKNARHILIGLYGDDWLKNTD